MNPNLERQVPRKFLEDYPLHRKFKKPVPVNASQLLFPAIKLKCIICDSAQTFNERETYWPGYRRTNHELAGGTVTTVYKCTSCNTFLRTFTLHFGQDRDWIQKTGQYPPWDISLEGDLEKALGEQATIFKRGKISESQGYGIGAAAYYRRVVEEIIDELLAEIPNLMKGEEREEYEEALEKTKQTTRTSEKIELVKDLLPPILRPRDINPLSTLHSELSKRLHEKSDQESLEDAEQLRQALVFLVTQVRRRKQEADRFTASMQKFLDKKAEAEASEGSED